MHCVNLPPKNSLRTYFCHFFFFYKQACVVTQHLLLQTHSMHIISRTYGPWQYLGLCLCTHAITCELEQVHVNVSVISCVSGDRKLAATDSTDNLIQTLSASGGWNKRISIFTFGPRTREWRKRLIDGKTEREGEMEEKRDLKGDLSFELPKHLASAGVCNVGLLS